MKRIISALIVICFLFTNICYGIDTRVVNTATLANTLASDKILKPEKSKDRRDDMLAFGYRRLAMKTTDEMLNKYSTEIDRSLLKNLNFTPLDRNIPLPKEWKDNPVLQKTTFIEMFNEYIKRLNIDKKYKIQAKIVEFPVDKGSYPGAQWDVDTEDKGVCVLTLEVHPILNKALNHLLTNDQLFTYKIDGKRRVLSWGRGTVYSILKHEFRDLEKSGGHLKYNPLTKEIKFERNHDLANKVGGKHAFINDVLKLAFLNSIYLGKRFHDTNTFIKRLKWLFRDETAQKEDLPGEFVNIGHEERDKAIALAALIHGAYFKSPRPSMPDIGEEDAGDAYGSGLSRPEIKGVFTDIAMGKAQESPEAQAAKGTELPGRRFAGFRFNHERPLTAEETKAVHTAIHATIEQVKAAIRIELMKGAQKGSVIGRLTNDNLLIDQEFLKIYSVKDSGTGGVFILLTDKIYESWVKHFKAPLDARGARAIREKLSIDDIEKYYYIRESDFNQLTEEERATWARHEQWHIKIAMKALTQKEREEIAKYRSEEDFINHRPGCDIRPIMARLTVLKKQKEELDAVFRTNEEIIKKAGTIKRHISLKGYYEALKILFGKHRPFTVAQFAMLINKDRAEAKKILEELWLKNKKINHVKGFNNEIWYQWDPIGLVTMVSPDMTPDDIPVGAPMLVAIGHSEVRDYQDMSIEAIRAQRDLFLKTSYGKEEINLYRIVGPWGDFMPDEDYLKRGLRIFPITYPQIRHEALSNKESFLHKDIAMDDLWQEVKAIRKINKIKEMKSHEEYGAYYDILEPLLRAEFEKLVENVSKEVEKSGKMPDIIGAIKEKYPKFFELISPAASTENIIDQIINVMLNDLNEVKSRIIKEISTVYDINYQVRVLLRDVPIEAVLYQFINPYEPIEGIRTVAIPKEAAKLRLEKMIPVFLQEGIPVDIRTNPDKAKAIARVLEYDLKVEEVQTTLEWSNVIKDLRAEYRKRLKISYGGGAQSDNIEGMVVEAGYNGAFVARHIYKVENALNLALTATRVRKGLDLLYNFKANEKGPWMPWIQGYKEAGIDLEKVNIFHCVPHLFTAAAMAELRGEDVSRLFVDARENRIEGSVTIDAQTRGESIATRGVGSNSGILPAEFLAFAGATNTVIDPTTEYAAVQVKELVKAGITPIIPSYSYHAEDITRLKEELPEEIAAAIQTISNQKEMPAITPIGKVMEVSAELLKDELHPPLPQQQKVMPVNIFQAKGIFSEDVVADVAKEFGANGHVMNITQFVDPDSLIRDLANSSNNIVDISGLEKGSRDKLLERIKRREDILKHTRFININLERADRGNTQETKRYLRTKIIMMILARTINQEDVKQQTKKYHIFSYLIGKHTPEGFNVREFISLLAKDITFAFVDEIFENIANVINYIISCKPAQPKDEPNIIEIIKLAISA